MKRTLVVILLTVAALVLLLGAVQKSRSIPLDAHIAYFTVTADLERLTQDYRTLVDAMQTAWAAKRFPGEAAAALQARIVVGLDTIEPVLAQIPAGATERAWIDTTYQRLSVSMTTLHGLTERLLADQTEFTDRLAEFRNDGAEVARQLRANGRRQMATDIGDLMTATIAASQTSGSVDDGEIPFLLVTLKRDLRIDSNVPRATAAVVESAETILALKDDIESRLYQLGALPVLDDADALMRATSAGYDDAVAGAEQARSILAIYVVVLLFVVGLIGWRLRNSYRQLNRANDELGELNESLEHRVSERTEELSDALTNLKESQVQLVQAEKMSSLGQLVAGISHEINTPLLYLANNAEMTQERVTVISDFIRQSASALCVSRSEFDDGSAYQAHLIQGLRKLKRLLREHELEATVEDLVDLNRDSIEGLADLSDMAQSLKDFSRLDRAPIDNFDVNAGIEKTLTIARNSVKHKAEVIRNFGKLPLIECSPSKINQVFLNLVTNAAQAIEDQGEITISTALRGENHIIVSIRDTGCGIPPENLSKICDPFFTTKEVGTGTGLGLSIVDDIIRSHGGELLVESVVGTGSTFSVVLPIRQPAASNAGDADTNLAEAV